MITTKALAYLHRANILGARAYGVRIRLDPVNMRVHNVSSDDIIKALSPSRMIEPGEQPAKETWQSDEYELTHISRRFIKPEQYAHIILWARGDGEILRLNDVAKVEIGSSFYVPGGSLETIKDFVRIGHSLLALLAGWLGGLLSRWLRGVPVTPEVPAEGE